MVAGPAAVTQKVSLSLNSACKNKQSKTTYCEEKISRFLKERGIISRARNVFNEKEAIYLDQLIGFAELTDKMEIPFTKAWQLLQDIVKDLSPLQHCPNYGEFYIPC